MFPLAHRKTKLPHDHTASLVITDILQAYFNHNTLQGRQARFIIKNNLRRFPETQHQQIMVCVKSATKVRKFSVILLCFPFPPVRTCFHLIKRKVLEFVYQYPVIRSLIKFSRQNKEHILDRVKIQVVACFHLNHTPSMFSSDYARPNGRQSTQDNNVY